MATEKLSPEETGRCYDMWKTARIATLGWEPVPPQTRHSANFLDIEPVILEDGRVSYATVVLYNDNEKAKCIVRGYYHPTNDFVALRKARYYPEAHVKRKVAKELEDYHVHYAVVGWGFMHVDRWNNILEVDEVAIKPENYGILVNREAKKFPKLIEAWKVENGFIEEEPELEPGPEEPGLIINYDFEVTASGAISDSRGYISDDDI